MAMSSEWVVRGQKCLYCGSSSTVFHAPWMYRYGKGMGRAGPFCGVSCGESFGRLSEEDQILYAFGRPDEHNLHRLGQLCWDKERMGPDQTEPDEYGIPHFIQNMGGCYHNVNGPSPCDDCAKYEVSFSWSGRSHGVSIETE